MRCKDAELEKKSDEKHKTHGTYLSAVSVPTVKTRYQELALNAACKEASEALTLSWMSFRWFRHLM